MGDGDDQSAAIASVNLHFKNGQIVGEDLPSAEEQEALFNELVELSKTDQVRYYHRKREVAALLGIPQGVVDSQVKHIIKALETQVGGGAGDEDAIIIRDLVFIALRQAELHRNAIKDLFATFKRDGHL